MRYRSPLGETEGPTRSDEIGGSANASLLTALLCEVAAPLLFNEGNSIADAMAQFNKLRPPKKAPNANLDWRQFFMSVCNLIEHWLILFVAAQCLIFLLELRSVFRS